jgi:translation elongation factor EF-G
VVTGAPGTLSKTFSVLGRRGGQVVDSFSTIAGEMIEAMLPVRRSFGLMNELHDETKGHAQCSLSFDSMQAVPDQDQVAIITETRDKKKLPAKVPTAELFVDKL